MTTGVRIETVASDGTVIGLACVPQGSEQDYIQYRNEEQRKYNIGCKAVHFKALESYAEDLGDFMADNCLSDGEPIFPRLVQYNDSWRAATCDHNCGKCMAYFDGMILRKDGARWTSDDTITF